MLFAKLNPFVFFISLGIGLAVVYCFAPRPTKVVKFPNPINAGKIVYRNQDECFVYSPEKVECTEKAITVAEAKHSQPKDE
ncbi:hypothetical protein TetV_460 [Tetraselmis virus 1]|uniref:Uncharacterized protein n=1 Tax=Tetraselmis virus 1 TaxID=2060617 RepID=A0A2P0VNS4_9VIRU|nr:hypothetical protein QJ968_gp594 [Tetraselmis virus 1]AUF82542.1 hypothetical protein TetV_460 [Tetraselmis virus 1]